MDRKELLAKISSGEVTTVEQLEEMLTEGNPKSKKNKKAIGYARGMMSHEGKKDLNSYLIFFDKASSPDRDFDSED